NIVVGIDAPGTIASERYHQFLSLPLQIKEYRVKAGDFVREGEVLAELSPEDIETKLKAASTKLKDDSFALEKLKTEKNNNQLALAKKLDDLRAAGESAYQDKAGMLLSKKAAAEQGIAGKKALLAQGKASLSGDQTEKTRAPKKLPRKRPLSNSCKPKILFYSSKLMRFLQTPAQTILRKLHS
ncbi:MAG: hypothetical protein RR194_01985, partial [Ruthenibacterium sp.]